MKKIFYTCFLVVQGFYLTGQVSSSTSQSLLGYSGLLYTPTAYTQEWGSVYAGFTHYDKMAAVTFEAGINPERSFIANMGFLPFAEFTIRLTKPYQSNGEYGIGDRSISGRMQVLKERKWMPAILVGFNDLANESSYFNTTYIVASKQLVHRDFLLNGNIGYGHKLHPARRHYLIGVFGGVAVSWKGLEGMVEYDADNVNVGMGYTFKNILFAKAALLNLQYPSLSIGMQMNIR